MPDITEQQYKLFVDFIKNGIISLHEKKYKKLQKLKLEDILLRKNLYLFKTKYLQTPEEVVRSVIDAFISSSEETTFGNFLEKLAVYISQNLEGGQKSSTKGIDLELTRDLIRYLIDIKSGPNWGNSSQITKMEDNFKKARKTLQTSGGDVNTQFINGCCYGFDDSPEKGAYRKLCGQRFWQFITGDADFYLKMIEPLGYQAKEKSEEFHELYTRKLIAFTSIFHEDFVENGIINWHKLIIANSGIKKSL
ncbi:MAG: PmeII family type II restriction endonuclease [Ferruginibacter sp.]